MHPQEEGLVAALLQPLDGVVHGVAGAAFRVLDEFVALAGPRHLIVVNRETMIESKALFQHRRADEGGGVPTLLLEKAGQGRRGWRKDEPSGIAHLVAGWIQPGEDAGMRRRS